MGQAAASWAGVDVPVAKYTATRASLNVSRVDWQLRLHAAPTVASLPRKNGKKSPSVMPRGTSNRRANANLGQITMALGVLLGSIRVL